MEREAIEVDYRVAGEDKWAPFRRWLFPKLEKLAGFLLTIFIGSILLFIVRWFQGLF